MSNLKTPIVANYSDYREALLGLFNGANTYYTPDGASYYDVVISDPSIFKKLGMPDEVSIPEKADLLYWVGQTPHTMTSTDAIRTFITVAKDIGKDYVGRQTAANYSFPVRVYQTLFQLDPPGNPGPRFLNLDPRGGKRMEYVVMFGVPGNWAPVNLSTTKSPYFYMPAVGTGTYMNQDVVNLLLEFLSRPINIPEQFAGVASTLRDRLSQFNPAIQLAGQQIYNTPKGEQSNILYFFIWCYVYRHIAAGLNRNGNYVKSDMQSRLNHEAQIFKLVTQSLTPDNKKLLASIPLIDVSGNIENLPQNITNVWQLAEMEKVCAGYKGAHLYPIAKRILDEMTEGANNLANRWMMANDFKFQIEPIIYPVLVQRNYDEIV